MEGRGEYFFCFCFFLFFLRGEYFSGGELCKRVSGTGVRRGCWEVDGLDQRFLYSNCERQGSTRFVETFNH